MESTELTAILTEISIGDTLTPIRCAPLTLGPGSLAGKQQTDRNVTLSEVIRVSPTSQDESGFAMPSETVLTFKLISPLRVQSLVASR